MAEAPQHPACGLQALTRLSCSQHGTIPSMMLSPCISLPRMQVLEMRWRPELPEHLPEGYKSFVRQCWEEDREKVGALAAAPAGCPSGCPQVVEVMLTGVACRVSLLSIWPLRHKCVISPYSHSHQAL